ncbi:MAG: 6-bladed beta-propeller [Acidobacteriota bacterium]|jgi:hypothetical protein|nr:6-bladed beta-propeller [Acidobacteriota bacterium]
MPKRLICMIAAIILPSSLMGARVLPQVFKPAQLLVMRNATIMVFDRAAGLLLFEAGNTQPKIIGAFGQGPGEYDNSAYVSVQDEKIYLSTPGKMVVFDFQGSVVRETRHSLDLFRNHLIPLPGSGWLADLAQTDYSPRGGTTIKACLLDHEFTIIKELYRRVVPLPMREVRLYPFAVGSVLAGDRIITATEEENGSLQIFDLQGKPMGAVVVPRTQWRKPTSEEVAERMEAYRKRAGDPAFWKELKKRITIPDQIPNILDFRAAKEGILVRSPDLQNGKRRFLFFDLTGTFIKEFFLPDAGPLYDFANGAYHYLETTDEDHTCLHTLHLTNTTRLIGTPNG